MTFIEWAIDYYDNYEEAIFQQTHGMSSAMFDRGVQATQWDVR